MASEGAVDFKILWVWVLVQIHEYKYILKYYKADFYPPKPACYTTEISKM